ncbi:MAG: hypothetical protein E4H00_03180 [Myxococcales bacterium]|nr:MAG: hypothetical protein E4H00_03180 [Myxococcales bacterium]
MSVLEEKLAGVDQTLAELGKSEEEISALRTRCANAEPVDLQAVDSEFDTLSEGVHLAPARVAEAVEESWDGENTEIEIIDESDFVLLVDESDLEELEKVGEDDALKTSPPPLPEEGEEGEEGDGFFKKLFGSRRTSSRPQ